MERRMGKRTTEGEADEGSLQIKKLLLLLLRPLLLYHHPSDSNFLYCIPDTFYKVGDPWS